MRVITLDDIRPIIKRIWNVFGIICIVISIILHFLNFEDILKNNYDNTVISYEEIDYSKDYTGMIPADNKMLLKSKEEWEKLRGNKYVTVIPQEIIKTDIYGLARWKDKEYIHTYIVLNSVETTVYNVDEIKIAPEYESTSYIPYYIIL